MALLEVSGLTAGYGIVQVLFGLDFTVDAGEAVVILGANGSGKTTTLRAVCGMIDSAGEVLLDGQRVTNQRPDQLLRSGVAHVPQGRGTIVDLSVEDNLRIGAGLASPQDEHRGDPSLRRAEHRVRPTGLEAGGAGRPRQLEGQIRDISEHGLGESGGLAPW